MCDFSFLSELLEKGKPLERVGRKATGLSSLQANMAAGLPGKRSTFQSCCAMRGYKIN
ncbi:hypothetical protein D1BOALGB6SA_3060 [Olavius sp. associated proteobacterium Delta 1]|nr:hypothetical protein D1BOALGB6SA_3060 [Olavius sp. associated proteobacterium Delta 1]